MGYDALTILEQIPLTLNRVLEHEQIPHDNRDVFKNQLAFMRNDLLLKDNEKALLKTILCELKERVIPLFSRKSNYDIIGKFYEEFLRYAGIANVKQGIVLTPSHITTLFTELIDIKTNDVILDPCCGSGAFLIAGMNKIISQIEQSSLNKKSELIANVKSKQIIGFEIDPYIYALALSNMLFRGDGKSQVFQEDFFSKAADGFLQGVAPTIGFINPPYGGKDNADNPTKKEIQFLQRLLDVCSRYVVMIAPLSTYIGENELRNQILSKHTLKYVIHTPKELFMPNAAAVTAIAVFETHTPHNNKEVVFYDLQDDGLVLAKTKGRTDLFGKWNGIKAHLLHQLKHVETQANGVTLLKAVIKEGDEWCLFAHSKTDYDQLNDNHFLQAIKEYVVFSTKRNLGFLNKEVDPITLLEILSTHITLQSANRHTSSVTTVGWGEFNLRDLFIITGTKTTPIKELKRYGVGNFPYITTKATDNGLEGLYDFWTEEGGVLTMDSAVLGYCAYQPDNFSASDHVEKLTPRFAMNRYTALFMVALLRREMFRFSYGRKAAQVRLKKITLKLPVTPDKQPDWLFMEKFIKALPYSSHL